MENKIGFLNLLKEKRGREYPIKVKYKYFRESITKEEMKWVRGLNFDMRVRYFINLFTKEEIETYPVYFRKYYFSHLISEEDKWGFDLKDKIEYYLEYIRECDLNHNGDLKFWYSHIKSLPDNLHIKGTLSLLGCEKIKELPSGLDIGGDLILEKTMINKLPYDIKVGGNVIW